MKNSKQTTHTRRRREMLIAELERVIDYSRRVLVESKAEVRRIRRELAHVLR
jgi:hypothetical protein